VTQALPLAATAAGRQRLTGIALLLGACSCLACLDACAKWLSRTADPLQTASVRYVGSSLLVAAFLNPRTRPGILRTRSLWLQIARSSCLVLGTVCIFSAVRYLPLAEVTCLAFSAPLIIALLAGPVLGERLGAHRIAAVLAGFAGVLVVTRPWGGAHPAALLAALAACANALYAIATRLLAARDPPETTLFYTGLVGSALLLPVAPLVWVPPPTPSAWLVLASTGALGALGHWLLILAYRQAPASTLAPFLYAQLLCATALGLLVFGEVPDRWTLVGAAVLIASGLYLLRHEGRRA
jgi:drug/metabolite transporter (DMT)-like permease